MDAACPFTVRLTGRFASRGKAHSRHRLHQCVRVATWAGRLAAMAVLRRPSSKALPEGRRASAARLPPVPLDTHRGGSYLRGKAHSQLATEPTEVPDEFCA